MSGGAVMRVRLFGKLPAHGDFVARGLAAEERDTLDRWLSDGMTQARARLGAKFEERWDRAPPWRFAGSDMAGVLAPSVDAAGRRYPIYLALAEGVAGTAERCEELIYAAFAQRWDADRLAEAAAELPAAGEEAMAEPAWWTIGGEGFAPATCPGARPADLLAKMLMSEEGA
ncbi:type VI secretion system-associated protein TagF [Sphingomonas sp. S2-65]|uniref:type VI secretion system-associated protein TagF n=1 Tax=Sphingomonas sp. S2-65 TaxID=2903960 RepID=UPI001F18872B|nr:type VI secretion system-associated protein TagF [Sphingomonas sp. S2-65]UYY57207.1 type VI secretion system-associated protein TagF [Sphingomonas sp. S2-65]